LIVEFDRQALTFPASTLSSLKNALHIQQAGGTGLVSQSWGFIASWQRKREKNGDSYAGQRSPDFQSIADTDVSLLVLFQRPLLRSEPMVAN
jgi:hypothetical protein